MTLSNLNLFMFKIFFEYQKHKYERKIAEIRKLHIEKLDQKQDIEHYIFNFFWAIKKKRDYFIVSFYLIFFLSLFKLS